MSRGVLAYRSQRRENFQENIPDLLNHLVRPKRSMFAWMINTEKRTAMVATQAR